MLPGCATLSDLWLGLVKAHGVTGFRTRDGRLVAAMQSYGISRLLTFNAADFRTLPPMVMDPATP